MIKAESDKTAPTSRKNGDVENKQQMDEDKQMIGGCCVCSDDTGYVENLLVYCDGHNCQVAVHQACYGISNVPPGAWYCSRCDYLNENKNASPTNIFCEFCPSKEGAMKRTDNGKWAHVVCALYIPEITFGNNRSMEPIITKNISQERFNKKCSLCELKNDTSSLLNDSTSNLADLTSKSNGVYVNCNKSGCKHWFHVTCAQQAGLLCENDRNSLTYCIYCRFHFAKIPESTKRIPAFSYKILNHLTKKEQSSKLTNNCNNSKAKKKNRLSEPHTTINSETLKSREEKRTGSKTVTKKIDKSTSLLSKSAIVEALNENVKSNQSIASQPEPKQSNKKSSSLLVITKNAPTSIESNNEVSKKVSSSYKVKNMTTTATLKAKNTKDKTESKEANSQIATKIEPLEPLITIKQDHDDEKKSSFSPTTGTASSATIINFNQQQSTDSEVSCSFASIDIESSTASSNCENKAQINKEIKSQKRKARSSSQNSVKETLSNNGTNSLLQHASTTNNSQKRIKTNNLESSNLNPLTPPPSVHDIQSSKDHQAQPQQSQKEQPIQADSHVDIFGNQLNSNATFASNVVAYNETIKEIQYSVANSSSSNQNKNSELFEQKSNEFKMPNEILCSKPTIENYPTPSGNAKSTSLLSGNIPDTLEELLMTQWTLGAELIGEHTQKQMDIIKLLNLLKNCKKENEQLEKSLTDLQKRYEYLTSLNHQLNEIEFNKLKNSPSSPTSTWPSKKNAQAQNHPSTPNKLNQIESNVLTTPTKSTTSPTKQMQDQTPFLITASPISPANSSPRHSRLSTSPSIKTNSTLMEYALSALAAVPSHPNSLNPSSTSLATSNSRQQIQSPLSNPIHHVLNFPNQLLNQSGSDSASSASKTNPLINNLSSNVQQHHYLQSLQSQINPLQLQYAFMQYLSTSSSLNGSISTPGPSSNPPGMSSSSIVSALGTSMPIASMSTFNNPLSAHSLQNHGSSHQPSNFSTNTSTSQIPNTPNSNAAGVAASALFASQNSTSHQAI
jgi:hypothetical protein